MFRARKLPCFRARLRQHIRVLPQKQSPKQQPKAPRAIAGLFAVPLSLRRRWPQAERAALRAATGEVRIRVALHVATSKPASDRGFFHAIILRYALFVQAMSSFRIHQQGRAMKHGLAVLAAGLMAMWLAACQPARVPDRITVASLSLKVDASDPAHVSCQSFALTRDDVSTYFRTATEVSGPEFHDRSIILPCRYEGALTMEGGMWSFSINAGGAGYLYRADGTQRRYLCEQRCQKALAWVFGAD